MSFSYSKRDWINLIIILSLVQGIIWFVSFIYANNSSALGYVSFAGTIISIILAVLAIGYTYAESVKQKNSSDTVVNQINILNDVIKNIQIEASALEKISEISNNLQNLSSSFNSGLEGINATHRGVQNLSDIISKSFGGSSQVSVTKVEGDVNKFMNNIAAIRLAPLDIAHLALYLVKDKKTDRHPLLEASDIIKEYTKVANNGLNDTAAPLVISGIVVALFSILTEFGLISYNATNKEYKITNEYENIIKQKIVTKDATGYDNRYNDIRSLLIKEVTLLS